MTRLRRVAMMRGAGVGPDTGGILTESDVADLLSGYRPVNTGHYLCFARSVIDRHWVVAQQVLHKTPCPETASVRAAPTRSTTPLEACCNRPPSGTPVQRHATG